MTTTTVGTATIGEEPVTVVQHETPLFVVTACITASGVTLSEDWALKP